jgi:hypothetical protein
MHCKDISFQDADFPLTADGIAAAMQGRKAYTRAEYLVLHGPEGYAVLRQHLDGGKDLFREVRSFEVLSLPGGTDYVEDPTFDALNAPATGRVQSQHLGRTVIVKGMFSHISIVRGVTPLKIKVIDTVPPSPSKLRVLVQRALDSGFVDLPVVPEYIDSCIGSLAAGAETDAVMFPCRVSGLEADRRTYFLDRAPEIGSDTVTLVGCHLSEAIFEELYGHRPECFRCMCPADIADSGEKTIVKCCRVKSGHILEGNIVKVPWGTTVPEIVDAINSLFLHK